MTPDTRYVSTKCFSSDKEEKNQGGTAESFVPTKGGRMVPFLGPERCFGTIAKLMKT